MKLFSYSLGLIFLLCSFYAVSPVKDKAPPDPKRPRHCNFSISQTSPLEKHPRPRSAQTKSTCSEDLIELTSLASITHGNFFGAPHEMAVAIARFMGLFLNEESDISPWRGEYICSNHLNELSRNFNGRIYAHRFFSNNQLMCGFPEKNHKRRARNGLELTYSQSKYLLENRNFLLLPGTPMCQKHHEEMIGMAESSAHPSNLDMEGPTDMDGDGDVNMEIDGEEGVCDEDNDEDSDSTFTARTTPNPLQRAFYEFADKGGISNARCRKKWSKLTDRAKMYRTHTGEDIFELVVSLLADTDEGQSELKMRVLDVIHGRSPGLDETLVARLMLEAMTEQYKQALTPHDRVWTLAPFTKLFHESTVAQYIDGLSKRTWDTAKRMAIDLDSFAPPEQRVLERYDVVKLVYFVNFITSPYILIQLPFGSSTVKDSYGHKITVTNAVRQAGIYAVIDQYTTYMKEAGLEALLLGRTTMYKILSYLPIKKAHSMTCVDGFQADATNGFIGIGRMWDDFVESGITRKQDGTRIKRGFDEIKLYLKGNFALHVKMESVFSDHCILHALSDPKNHKFAAPHTSHKHANRCPDCLLIENIIKDTKELLQQYSKRLDLTFDQLRKVDAYIHDFDKWAEAIMDLKAHIVRQVYISMVLKNMIAETKEDEATIIFDFSQKWEGQQYREPQSEYYAKSGTGWHMTYTHANISGKAVSHYAAHIMKDSDQDATSVVAITTHYLRQLRTMGIKRVRIWSDNAPNYHNSALIASMASMKEKTGVEVVSYSFFEKQAGKSHADRGIGLCKRKMLSYRDELHDVITAEQMFEALNATKQLRGFSIYLSTGVEVKTISTTKIPGIKQLGHFQYHGKSSAIVWRFRGIGDGEHIHNLHATEAELKISKEGGKLATDAINLQDRKRIREADKKPYGTYDEPTFWILPHERAPVDDVEPNDVDDDIVNPSRPNPYSPAGAAKSSLFYCHCGASFIRHSNFLKHLTSQAHKIRPDKIRLMDRVLGLFSRAIENLLTPVGFSPASDVLKKFMEKPEAELPMGWALSTVKKRGRYPETTKAFVKKLFDEYAAKGLKLKAPEAERMMRADPQLMPSEWMERPQLKNYINTLVANLPKLRVYRNVLEQAEKEKEEEEEHESKDEMEVIPLADEDIFITEEDFHAHLSKTTLKKFFSHVDKPIMPNTQVPEDAIEYD